MSDDVLWGMVWTNWRTIPPQPNTIVLARYDDGRKEKPIRVRTCKRGCCIDAGFGSMALPAWWTATDDQTSPLEWESKPEPQPEKQP